MFLMAPAIVLAQWELQTLEDFPPRRSPVGL
jgi:hypothetical protein